jgi:rare lipoprotein A (peptidoglycan hydrolase)
MRNDLQEGRRHVRVVAAWVGALGGALLLGGVASAERGYTTWYGPGYHGRVMASGRIFDQNDPTTTASNQFPFGTWLRVTNPNNGRVVHVQVRDRGGFTHALDLSRAAFFELEPPNPWGFWVEYEVVPGPGEEPRAAAAAASARGTAREPAAGGLRAVGAKAPAGAPAAAPSAPKPASQAKPAAAVAPKPAAPKPAAPPKQAAEPKPAAAGAAATEHVVETGETLRRIAERHGLSVSSLVAWNGLENPDAISVGQTLRLRAPTRQYVVKAGDSLNGIAAELGVPREVILARNEIEDPDHLAVGQELVVPS